MIIIAFGKCGTTCCYHCPAFPSFLLPRSRKRFWYKIYFYATISRASTTWRKHSISREQVEVTNRHITDGSVLIWQYVEELFDDAEEQGYFSKTKGTG